ncbi:MAG: hypothetical protein E7661_03835 [Ruminococcaceae bacterium]|nr:hypothetical protein [Oscillospiraceae bacterium]
MKNLFISLAGFRILMQVRYDYTVNQCKDYVTDFSPDEADFIVSASEEEIERERSLGQSTGMTASSGYAESICLYRNLATQLPERDALLMHAAVISDGEYAYAFTAPSGTGKSTHIRLWRTVIGDSIFVINGDKPILRCVDGVWRAYGTPWCGKEGWHTNTSRPLAGICFLSRGEENRITKLLPAQSVPAMMHQILLPTSAERVKTTLRHLDHLVTHVPLYRLECTISQDAARLAHDTMKPASENE